MAARKRINDVDVKKGHVAIFKMFIVRGTSSCRHVGLPSLAYCSRLFQIRFLVSFEAIRRYCAKQLVSRVLHK
jgi:hypothetical protein